MTEIYQGSEAGKGTPARAADEIFNSRPLVMDVYFGPLLEEIDRALYALFTTNTKRVDVELGAYSLTAYKVGDIMRMDLKGRI